MSIVDVRTIERIGQVFPDTVFTLPATKEAEALSVVVSGDPATRLKQAESFWRRNPGFAKVQGVGDAIRGALYPHGPTRGLAHQLEETPAGVGQSLLDQMGWQIRTGRQPHSPWWMTMNAHLVGDGLVAEAAKAANRTAELTEPQYLAWDEYLRASDAIKQRIGQPLDELAGGPGAIDPPDALPLTALDRAWEGASLEARLDTAFHLKPAARLAYWRAHDASIGGASEISRELLDEMAKVAPREADFSDDWARSVEIHGIMTPPAASHWSIPIQKFLLPQVRLADDPAVTLPQRGFMKALDAFHDAFPRTARKGPRD